jgi:hypothetical protein
LNDFLRGFLDITDGEFQDQVGNPCRLPTLSELMAEKDFHYFSLVALNGINANICATLGLSLVFWQFLTRIKILEHILGTAIQPFLP